MAPAPVAVKLNEYVPSDKLVVKAILPFVPKHVVGLLAVPAVKVGVFGSVKVFELTSVPVQPLFVTKKLL